MRSPTLKGYKRLPGSAHRYLTPNGVEISEYEYRSRKAKRLRTKDKKPVFANASQQRRFREDQEFLRLRFNIRSMDSSVLVDAGSDMEIAIVELSRDPDFGKSGHFPNGPEGRFADLLAAMGAPDYYFWRFWYSETKVG
jgi:hypothetical protein